MKSFEFSFKREAVWILILSFTPIVIAITLYLFLWLLRSGIIIEIERTDDHRFYGIVRNCDYSAWFGAAGSGLLVA